MNLYLNLTFLAFGVTAVTVSIFTHLNQQLTSILVVSQWCHSGVTVGVTVDKPRSTEDESLVHHSRSRRFITVFAGNFFAKFIYESLTHYLPPADNTKPLPRITNHEPCFVIRGWNLVSQ